MANIIGTDNSDTLDGTTDNDILQGLDGDDVLNGAAGDDDLYGGAGVDTLDGGDGLDWASYDDSDAGVTIDLSATPDASGYVRGSGGFAEGDMLKNIEYLYGSDFADWLTGDDNDNVLDGHDGDDILDGGLGDDRLFGGFGGDDTLNGGAGNDTLNGGAGNDTFQFFPSNLVGGSIKDFTDGEDVIDLTAFTGINSMDDLDVTSYGDNVRIEVSGTDYLTIIILSDFDMSNLDNSDFMF